MKSLIAASLITIALTSTALAEPDAIRISTGGQGNAYWNACETLKKNFAGAYPIECIASPGSAMNLQRLKNGEAELAFVQADSLAVAKKEGGVSGLDQIASVGKEYAQLVCNTASGISAVSDLESSGKKPKILVGAQGSGAEITWRNWVIEDEDYRNAVPVYEAPTGPGALKLKQNQVQCALVVSALGGATMTALDNASDGKLKLVDINDGDFNDSADIDNNPVYEFTEIDSSTYKNLLGWSDVDTISQDAFLVGAEAFTGAEVNKNFMDALANALFLNSELVK